MIELIAGTCPHDPPIRVLAIPASTMLFAIGVELLLDLFLEAYKRSDRVCIVDVDDEGHLAVDDAREPVAERAAAVAAEQAAERRDLRAHAREAAVRDRDVQRGVALQDRALLERVLRAGRERGAHAGEEACCLGCDDAGGDA